ncbi:hypothetical protein HDV02_004787 [Globomyces sp. JEL0801]|nr:hypothetical protein HDV02_004787 [Globomyces sp. JEL0801]
MYYYSILLPLVACVPLGNFNPFEFFDSSTTYTVDVGGRPVEYFLTTVPSGKTLAITNGDLVLGEVKEEFEKNIVDTPILTLHEPFATMELDRSSFTRLLWPNKTLNFSWGSVQDSAKMKLIQAMEDWKRLNDIRFQEVPVNSTENHVEMSDGSGCFANVGMIGGKQILGLSVSCDMRSARHELAHALGFIHEQSRPDRDEYVNINFDKIQVNSMMHYSGTAFSIDGSPTITRKDGSKIERKTEITLFDSAGMYLAYPADEVHVVSAKLVDDKSSCLESISIANGAQIGLAICSLSNLQSFYYEKTTGFIRKTGSNFCISTRNELGHSTLQLMPCQPGSTTQRWKYEDQQIKSFSQDNVCIDATGDESDSMVLRTNSCNDESFQKFTLKL